jgi:putative nucleotidyltransferase with HDIG domain
LGDEIACSSKKHVGTIFYLTGVSGVVQMDVDLKILIVEDSEDDVLLLLRELRRGGYNPKYELVSDSISMRLALQREEWDLILSDYSLPNFSGQDALVLWKEMGLDIPFIVISGTIGEDLAVRMMKAGASDYLMKGSLARLGAAIERELREVRVRHERKQTEEFLRDSEIKFTTFMDTIPMQVFIKDSAGQLVFANRMYSDVFQGADWTSPEMQSILMGNFARRLVHSDQKALFGEVTNTIGEVNFNDGRHSLEIIEFKIQRNTLPPLIGGITLDITEQLRAEEEIRQAHAELSLAYDSTLAGWSKALELREDGTAGHSQRVATLSVKLARRMGISEEERVHIRRGALLHDIGKMGIPDSILLKAHPLTDEEWIIMRKHPLYAYEMLSPIPYLAPALDIPYCHHERWDGSGYPRGLKGNEIPLAARIFAVIDVYDAVKMDRVYNKAWSDDEVKTYLIENAGILFDPQVVNEFVGLLDDGEIDPLE